MPRKYEIAEIKVEGVKGYEDYVLIGLSGLSVGQTITVPGDEIIGFVTRGRGISIHRTDCVNIINLPEIERSRLIDAEWQDESIDGKGRYFAEITIYANNRNGLLADVSRALTEKNIDIQSMNTRTSKQGVATMNVAFEISSKEELNRVIDKLHNIESVLSIERTTG